MTDPQINNGKTTNFKNLTIGYLLNPDKVFYNEMDFVIIKNLENFGATVEPFNLEEIYYSMNKEGLEVFIKGKKVNWDGFLSYGYMSNFHFQAYLIMVSAFENANIPTLHKREYEDVLANKLLQSYKFSRSGLTIPETHAGFDVPSVKNFVEKYYPEGGILKKLDDYAGDGVFHIDTNGGLITYAAKCFWKNEYLLIQKFVPDSIGKSVRVLCVNGKAIAIAEYNHKTGDFKSNNSYSEEKLSLDSLMKSEKYQEYANVGEKAIEAIGDLVIGGVDIIDSKQYGLVVLEINGWPDLFDIEHSTGVPVFELFSKAFLQKCHKNK